MGEQWQAALAWGAGHSAVLTLVGVFSAIIFTVSLASLPWLAAAIPADYFSANRRPKKRHPLLRLLGNLTGALLLLCGIAMLVLPGQGILTILVALILIDYPGKTALERYLVTLPKVHKSLNWLRRQRGVGPLAVD